MNTNHDHDKHAGEACDFDPETGVCATCGVTDTACDDCDGVGYHRDDCPSAEPDASLFDAIQAPLAEAFSIVRDIEGELCDVSARLGELSQADLERVRRVAELLKKIRA